MRIFRCRFDSPSPDNPITVWFWFRDILSKVFSPFSRQISFEVRLGSPWQTSSKVRWSSPPDTNVFNHKHLFLYFSPFVTSWEINGIWPHFLLCLQAWILVKWLREKLFTYGYCNAMYILYRRFSCPEQRNRWPCHWVTHWVTEWVIFYFDITEWP